MSVGTPGALRAGFAALSRWRLVLLLTASAAVLGVVAASPLASALDDSLRGTLAGDHLLRNHPEFAPTDAFDFLREKAPALSGAVRGTMRAGLLGLLFQIFFAGGIVETVGRASRAGAYEFWTGARRNFAHNLKCFALFALMAGVTLAAWIGLMTAIGSKVFEKAPPNTPGRFAWTGAVIVVSLLLFGLWTLLYDFARAARRSMPAIGALAAFAGARRRLRGRWLRGLALLLFWTAVGSGAFAAVFALAWGQRTPSGVAVVLNLFLLGLLLAVRPVARVAAWGSILALFDGSPSPEPIPVREILPPPEFPEAGATRDPGSPDPFVPETP
jgi:hypothetical protein